MARVAPDFVDGQVGGRLDQRWQCRHNGLLVVSSLLRALNQRGGRSIPPPEMSPVASTTHHMQQIPPPQLPWHSPETPGQAAPSFRCCRPASSSRAGRRRCPMPSLSGSVRCRMSAPPFDPMRSPATDQAGCQPSAGLLSPAETGEPHAESAPPESAPPESAPPDGAPPDGDRPGQRPDEPSGPARRLAEPVRPGPGRDAGRLPAGPAVNAVDDRAGPQADPAARPDAGYRSAAQRFAAS